MRFTALGLLALCIWAQSLTAPAQAQTIGVVQSDILVLDTDRLFGETRYGKTLNEQYLAQRDALIALNRERETELKAEEQALTDLRSQKTPEEFKALADAFDEKVQKIRQDSDRAVRDLERRRDEAPLSFMRVIEPILIEIMQEADGAVVLDVRAVLIRANVVDITDLAIARVDQKIGDGPQVDTSPAEDAPTRE